MFCIAWLRSKKRPRVTFYDYDDEEVPVFRSAELKDVNVGISYQIGGYLPSNCERFAIHLCTENKNRDIALRINPRFPQRYIVRNSRISKKWGRDEDSSECPFRLQRSSVFTIQIFVSELAYMISLNRFQYTKFLHRLPYSSVKHIEVYGDVTNIKFSRKEPNMYPERFHHTRAEEILFKSMPAHFRYPRTFELQLPYYGTFPNSYLHYGTHVRLEGRVKLLPLSFFINLQAGHLVWPHPVVAFHFRCRFAKHRRYLGKNIVSKNSWFNGRWMTEECSAMVTELRPGKVFSLVINRSMQFYEVFLNKRYMTNFRFRINPNFADTVFVLGDIKLWTVVIENHDDSTFDRHPFKTQKIGFFRNLL